MSDSTLPIRLSSAKKNIFPALVVFLLILPPPGMLLGLAGALLLLFFALRGSLLGATRPRPLNLVMLVLAFFYAVGFAFGPHNELAVSSAGEFVAGSILFYLILSTANQTKSFADSLGLLLLVGIGLSVLAPLTVVEDISKSFAFSFMPAFAPRLGKTINSNVMSGALVALLPLALGALVQRISTRTRLIAALAFFPMGLVLLFLQSRSAWLAFLVACAVMLVLWNKWFLPVVLIVGAGFFALAPQLNLPSFDAAAGPFRIVGRIGQREEIWALGAQLIREHPVTGIGAGAFEAYSAAQVKQVEPGVYETPVPHAHNWILQIALDAGIPGLLAFAALVALSARSLWRARRSETLRPIFIGMTGAWAAMLVQGLTDATMIDTRASLIFWWILGSSLVWDYGHH